MRGARFRLSRIALRASVATIVPGVEWAGLRRLTGQSPRTRRMRIFGNARVLTAVQLDGGWIAHETYRAAQEVSALDIDGRISPFHHMATAP